MSCFENDKDEGFVLFTAYVFLMLNLQAQQHESSVNVCLNEEQYSSSSNNNKIVIIRIIVR